MHAAPPATGRLSPASQKLPSVADSTLNFTSVHGVTRGSGRRSYEQRGRMRYARVSAVQAREDSRISRDKSAKRLLVHPDLAEFAA